MEIHSTTSTSKPQNQKHDPASYYKELLLPHNNTLQNILNLQRLYPKKYLIQHPRLLFRMQIKRAILG